VTHAPDNILKVFIYKEDENGDDELFKMNTIMTDSLISMSSELKEQGFSFLRYKIELYHSTVMDRSIEDVPDLSPNELSDGDETEITGISLLFREINKVQ
jgi:hypothetical protein